jgi:hypothetical protein
MFDTHGILYGIRYDIYDVGDYVQSVITVTLFSDPI